MRSHRLYTSIQNRFVEWAKQKRKEVGESAFREFVSEQNVSDKTARVYLSVLRALTRPQQVAQATNPADLFPPGNDICAIRDIAIAAVVRDTGMHLKEVISLRVGDVDIDRCTVRSFGGGMQRISAETCELLKRYLAVRPTQSDYLFVSTKGTPRRLSYIGAQRSIIRTGQKLHGNISIRAIKPPKTQTTPEPLYRLIVALVSSGATKEDIASLRVGDIEIVDSKLNVRLADKLLEVPVSPEVVEYLQGMPKNVYVLGTRKRTPAGVARIITKALKWAGIRHPITRKYSSQQKLLERIGDVDPERVLEAISKLDEPLRKVIEGRLSGKTLKQLSSEMSYSKQWICRLQERAIEQIKELLSQEQATEGVG